VPIVGAQDIAPMAPGLHHTLEQHRAVLALGVDVAQRWTFPPRWHRTGRLIGHEDVNPLRRTTRTPPAGWDPGYLRPAQDRWFDCDYVRAELDQTHTACPEVAA